MTARSSPTAILRVVSLFCLASGGWAKLVDTVIDVCDTVGAREPVRPMTEVTDVTAVVDSAVGSAVLVRPEESESVEGVVVENTEVDSAVGSAVLVRPEERESVEGVVVENTEVLATADSLDQSIAENGYGSSEVVNLVSQQFSPPRPCPAAPAQHQLLPLGSQRLTSVKSSN